MSEYKYTQDWFGWAPPVWTQIKEHMQERKNFLEIGSFEGRSTVWTIENMMDDGGEIVCIDTWEGGEEHTNGEMDGAEKLFDENMKLAQQKFPNRHITRCKGISTTWLPALAQDKRTFDFVYVDGSHTAKDVLTDACMSWPMLKRGGFMVFDDYLWKPDGFTTIHRPKIAIDTFVNLFEEDLVLVYVGYQLIVRKMV